MSLTCNRRLVALTCLSLSLASCRATPVAAPTTVTNGTAAAQVVGELSVEFLNKFSARNVSPDQCVIDFSDGCNGKREELFDITNNRKYFEIVGARLGAPTVTVAGSGNSASVSMPCAWDSRVKTCDTADCQVGAFGSVEGTCLLTAVREAGGWKLCTSNFSGRNVTPATRTFFAN